MNDLCQFPTPAWVAAALFERHFGYLRADAVVCDPTCGPGAFLEAVPAHIRAIGVEIDSAVAAVARVNSRRQVIEGDFLTVQLDFTPTAIIGNPPFRSTFIDRFLARCHDLLPVGHQAGFILPAYAFRTASRVAAMLDLWSITQEMLPRSAFCYRMREPLLFVLFAKDKRRLLVGFALYEEECDRQQIGKEYRELLINQHGSAWRAVCRLALERLGGEATLPQIYAELERNRPTRTTWWREKIRQTLRVYANDFTAITTGRYRLANCRAPFFQEVLT